MAILVRLRIAHTVVRPLRVVLTLCSGVDAANADVFVEAAADDVDATVADFDMGERQYVDDGRGIFECTL